MIKKTVALGITLLAGFTMLTACGKTESPTTSGTQPTTQNVETEKTEFAQGMMTYFENVNNKKNFTMNHKDSKENTVYKIDGAKMQVGDTYYQTINGKNYIYEQENSSYTEAEVPSIAFIDFSSASVSALSEKSANVLWQGSTYVATYDTSKNVVLTRDDETNTISNVGNTIVTIPEVKHEQTWQEKTAEVKALIAKLTDSYHYYTLQITQSGSSRTVYVDEAHIQIVTADTNVVYENGKSYTYDAEGDFWLTGEETPDANYLFSSYRSYGNDESVSEWYFQLDGKDYTVTMDDEGNLLLDGSKLSMTVSDFGTTTTTDLSNETVKGPGGETPTPISDDIIDEDGKYNIVLMHNLLNTWLREDNQFDDTYGEGVLNARFFSNNIELIDIVAINPTTDTLDTNCTYSDANGHNFARITLKTSKLDFTSKDNFVESLNSLELADIQRKDVFAYDDTVEADVAKTNATNILRQTGETENVGWAVQSTEITGLVDGRVVKGISGCAYVHGKIYKYEARAASMEDFTNNNNITVSTCSYVSVDEGNDNLYVSTSNTITKENAEETLGYEL